MSKTMQMITEESNIILQMFMELEEKTKDMDPADAAQERAILADCLGENEKEFESKVDGYIAVIREFKASEQAIADEIKRLQDRKKSFANRGEELRDLLMYAMKSIGVEKCKTPFNTVSLSKIATPPSVNENLIPEEYMKRVLDKTKLNRAIKELEEGESIPGVEILEKRTSLRIR